MTTNCPLLSAARPPVGLLAGAGRFPVYFAERARALGIPITTVGLRGLASEELIGLSQRFFRVGIARMGAMIRCFQRSGVSEVVMAGKVYKTAAHSSWRLLHLLPDWRTVRFWYNHRRQDNRDDSLLLGVIAEFERDGIHFGSALDYCPELLVRTGILTRRRPTAFEERDIAFGWELAKEMGRLDVGQSVAVLERSVLAVEAIEGTDQTIARAGQLCRRGGFVVVKVAKPQQDMRFDVPTVGCATIETMRQAGARVLAVEAGKTILLDEAETIALADQYCMTVVAVDAVTIARAA